MQKGHKLDTSRSNSNIPAARALSFLSIISWYSNQASSTVPAERRSGTPFLSWASFGRVGSVCCDLDCCWAMICLAARGRRWGWPAACCDVAVAKTDCDSRGILNNLGRNIFLCWEIKKKASDRGNSVWRIKVGAGGRGSAARSAARSAVVVSFTPGYKSVGRVSLSLSQLYGVYRIPSRLSIETRLDFFFGSSGPPAARRYLGTWQTERDVPAGPGSWQN